MKNKLLTFLLAISSTYFIHAQQLEIVLNGTTNDISGTTHNVTISNSDDISLIFNVINPDTASLDCLITRVNIYEPQGWANYFSWRLASDIFGGVLYPVSTDSVFTGFQAETLTQNEHGVLHAQISPQSVSSTPAHYRYFVGTALNPKIDSINIVVTTTLNVEELQKEFLLTVSPNPASKKVSIQASNFEAGKLKVVDVLGNVVLTSKFSGSKILNVENFRNGVYFIMISSEGNKTINRKLVVSH